jgi:hypothetical protein
MVAVKPGTAPTNKPNKAAPTIAIKTSMFSTISSAVDRVDMVT